MVARFRASRRPRPECQDRTLAGAERHTCGHYLEPRLRRRFPADSSPSDVDHDPLGAVVPQPDPSRARRSECDLSG